MNGVGERSPADGRGGWDGRPVLVVGVAVSGAAAARALLARGARVRVVDAGDGERQRTAAVQLRKLGATVDLGGLPAGPDGASLVVTSPGVPPTAPLIIASAAAGTPVWGEVELAWRWRGTVDWLAITGTNGKTTTTEMLGAILTAGGLRATTAGNIGTPIVEAVGAEPPYEALAVELSSFQLHYTERLVPLAAAVLNVAPDHLDWHGGADAYAAAKARIWPDAATIAVGNADDPASLRLLAAAPGRRVLFGRDPAACPDSGTDLGSGPGRRDGRDLPAVGVTVAGGYLVDHAFGGGRIVAVRDLRVSGPHMISNALAAAALARARGVAPDAIGAALAGFRAGAHRNAEVACIEGVRWVDDSKATNPHAAAASLAGYPSVVWIAGGLNKGLRFDELVREARGVLRGVVLIGTCADEIATALARHAPDVPLERAAGMDDAVKAAAALAREGDTVLLAPAAASMDMFRDYAARGDQFAQAVRAREG
ncbi:UDP-N-acetylmuramoyl-L-alanine--D-glutamate ligase [Frankia sp. AiPa1]|uniref:UDP-N-acetylmuramoyl-L-alanine--D-glutamate ligase n=1 Tax=Frankia sp. AiPa1 TaxID=573492 RepID=UPI00202B5713|nr:UDP-N-acetylmuramoyl-L-alanine--D-glutamate ligase [Frankia sp. AiPa1]MCL9757959.1 UDP-N-acetylmuramoyl-L-alanine--D-glutamate ligase [Frankia sp. AiPa1]